MLIELAMHYRDSLQRDVRSILTSFVLSREVATDHRACVQALEMDHVLHRVSAIRVSKLDPFNFNFSHWHVKHSSRHPTTCISSL